MEAKPWLPFNALSDGVLSGRFANVAREWALRWLGESQGSSIRVRADYEPDLAASGRRVLRTSCDQLVLAITPETRIRLAGTILGTRIPGGKVSPRDKDLLDDLATESLRDLLAAAAASFVVESTIGSADALDYAKTATTPHEFAMRFRISLGSGSEMLSILIRPEAAVRARKSAVKAPPSTSTPARPEAVIASLEVIVGASVGGSWLTLEDVSSLTEGDVIVLNRKIGDSLQLSINGKPIAGAACELERDSSALRLRILQVGNGAQA